MKTNTSILIPLHKYIGTHAHRYISGGRLTLFSLLVVSTSLNCYSLYSFAGEIPSSVLSEKLLIYSSRHPSILPSHLLIHLLNMYRGTVFALAARYQELKT